jgi:hypothetical protein
MSQYFYDLRLKTWPWAALKLFMVSAVFAPVSVVYYVLKVDYPVTHEFHWPLIIGAVLFMVFALLLSTYIEHAWDTYEEPRPRSRPTPSFQNFGDIPMSEQSTTTFGDLVPGERFSIGINGDALVFVKTNTYFATTVEGKLEVSYEGAERTPVYPMDRVKA